MKHLTTYVFVLSLWSAAAVFGQDVNYYGPSNYGASTVGESYSRGLGNVIQSRGQKNLSNSQAAINVQDAYSSAIDNNIKATNAYYEKKNIYKQQHAQENYEEAQKRAAHRAQNALQSPSTEDFDRTSGQVHWPKVLEQPQYDQYRKSLDALFQKRAETGALSSDDYMQAKVDFKSWRTQLTSQRDVYPDAILHQLVRFVLKMERELDDNLT